MDDQQITDRLKQSKANLVNRGIEAGREWATEDADFEQLSRLESVRSDWQKFPSACEGVHDFHKAISPDQDFDEFVENLFGDDRGYEFPTYLEGFADGAIEVWDRVKATV